jgi:hypothetical protein
MTIDALHFSGLLGIAVGVYAIVKRQIGFGAGTPRPQFVVAGPLAVVLGIAATIVGAWLLFYAK